MKGTIPTLESYKEQPDLFAEHEDYIFANSEWYPKGIKAHLLLMVAQAIAAVGGVAAVSEEGFKLGLATFVDRYMKFSYDPRDFARIGLYIRNQNKNQPQWIKEYVKDFYRHCTHFQDLADDIYFNFSGENLADIRETYIQLSNAALAAQSYGYITEVFTFTDTNFWAADYIHELAPTLTDEDIATLFQPSRPSFVNVYNEQLILATTDQDFSVLVRRYYWVKGSYFSWPSLTVEIAKEEKNNLDAKHEQISQMHILETKEALLAKTGVGAELKNFISLIEDCIAMQDERKANVLRYNYAVVRLLEASLAFLKDWTLEELLGLRPDELLLLLQGESLRLTKKDISKRNDNSVWLFTSDAYCVSDRDADTLRYGSIFGADEHESLVRGIPASKGKARGRAKIIFSEDDFGKVEDGDIIVTSMTRPEFMPILRKAAAFVTDEGGVTCHAAIVAREMKKPCVISTKQATRMFKDGDIIEVDADAGTVKII